MNADQPGVGWPLKIFTALVYMFLFGPVAAVILLSFNTADFASFPMQGVGLRWFAELFQNESVMRALKTSLVLGVLTAGICGVVGVLAAIALARYEFRGKRLMNVFLLTPLLVPETVLAVGLLLFMQLFKQPRSFSLLLMGHIMLALPYVVLVVHARLITIQKTFEEAAATLGANRLQVFREVTLPLLMPAVVAGLLLSFTLSFDNVTASIFWRPIGTETLPTEIYSMLRDSVSPEINALGTVMVAITIGLPLLGIAFFRIRSQRRL
ncbi:MULTISPECIES: ABC transporter permease [Rhizobium/Agrobacterium group]|uniref:ABC transporter n=2 Tax=Rhizobium/Agrobacterium group TaxID=227290 RepID=B9K3W9_ALLAM|nr:MULTISPECIES: ABC transporter permease [Rhizobium/Agrobacterium group]ACM39624.1 ABC transporter [Allorhizobium ampelinum S4]ASK49659.1 spermidine/putrescine ABC transporter permease [Agrobacterium vitis]MCF1436732.1 ABC transporter permease [Allorhizobium ampelinum]MCF1450290.1 ABC transporter permease [Allorhizobium ampelinum]MCF1495973.1 ABC transporter permease [Allorhizobium ampelinum]